MPSTCGENASTSSEASTGGMSNITIRRGFSASSACTSSSMRGEVSRSDDAFADCLEVRNHGQPFHAGGRVDDLLERRIAQQDNPSAPRSPRLLLSPR